MTEKELKEHGIRWHKNPQGGVTVTKSVEFKTLDEANEAYTKLVINYARLAKFFAISKILGYVKTIVIIVGILYLIYGG